MKHIYILLMILMIFNITSSQNKQFNDSSSVNIVSFTDVKACVKYFYDLIQRSGDVIDIIFNNRIPLHIDKSLNKELCQGYSPNEIYGFIKDAKVTTDGMGMTKIVQVFFPNNRVIYFEIDVDNKPYYSIITLYDTKGESFFVDKGDYLYRPGMINDIDGYVNIRNDANIKSKIVGKIRENELFYFIPTSDINWYKIFKYDNMKFLGYIYKNRIIQFDDFPETIKCKVRKDRVLD